MGGDLKIAAELLAAEGWSLVVVRHGRLLFKSRLPGIGPLLDALDNHVLAGSAVADKVVGRAAAMVVAEGRVTAVKAAVMSEGAASVLAEHGILYCADSITGQILNQERTDACPLEALTATTVVPAKGVESLRRLLRELAGAVIPEQVH